MRSSEYREIIRRLGLTPPLSKGANVTELEAIA
jgi:hypothetical protein